MTSSRMIDPEIAEFIEALRRMARPSLSRRALAAVGRGWRWLTADRRQVRFEPPAQVGDEIQVGDETYQIARIDSTTQITLDDGSSITRA